MFNNKLRELASKLGYVWHDEYWHETKWGDIQLIERRLEIIEKKLKIKKFDELD